jgi:hypothetical protein
VGLNFWIFLYVGTGAFLTATDNCTGIFVSYMSIDMTSSLDGSDVNHPARRPSTAVGPRLLQDERDGAKAIRPVLTRKRRHGGRHPPSPADIHYPGGHQVLRCFTWLDVSEPALMRRVYCI